MPTSGEEPCRRRQPELGQLRRHLLPPRRRADAHATRGGVDRDAGQRRGVEDQRALERAERAGVVPGRLGATRRPRSRGVGDDGGDLALVGRERDRLGLLVDQQVEGAAGGVPVGVAGADHAAEVLGGDR